jgi:hypothetical protein
MHDGDQPVLEAFDQLREGSGIVRIAYPEHQADVRVTESHLGASLTNGHKPASCSGGWKAQANTVPKRLGSNPQVD